MTQEIDQLVADNFLIFLLEKWKISSGEYVGESYSFRSHPFLLDIVKDNHPFKVIQKCAQGGISEVAVARAIWRAIYRKGNILYSFPAGEQMQQFVDARVRSAILNNGFLTEYVTGTLNLKKITLNGKQLYFRGAQKRRQIITVDVSALFADEIDEYEEGIIFTLNKRLGATRTPYREYFSTPSFHGVGVSLYYSGSTNLGERGSDQRVWAIKCEVCGKWNEKLIWPDKDSSNNVIDRNESESKSIYYKPDVHLVCRFCHSNLNVLSQKVQWVVGFATNSDYCHGYHVSKLMSPISDLNQMWLDSRDPTKEQEFYNSDLGEPYEPKGSRLTPTTLSNCRGNYLIRAGDRDSYCIAGIDIGPKVLHVTISIINLDDQKPKFIAFIECNNWDELEKIWEEFNIQCAVIDAAPDKEEATDFQKRHDNVWLAYYMQYMEKTPDQINIKYEDGVVHIHRTLMMEVVMSLFNEKKVLLPLDVMRIRSYADHMSSPVRALKQDIRGDWIPFYPKTRTPDHYFHSTLYNIVGHKLKPQPAKFKVVKIV